MGFLQVHIAYDPKHYDVLLGKLYSLPCDSLWEEEGSITAYFDEAQFSEMQLKERLHAFPKDIFQNFSISKLKEENWNAKWEEAFDPVEIDSLCYIYADFHEKKPGFEHYIRIAPKMAFGTGHHETTYMMIQQMDDIIHTGKEILDLGCGSGILSVFSYLKGARKIDAIDIEMPSVENAEEHKELNQVEYTVYHGGVEDVPIKAYDIVLANINRTVLLTYASHITDLVASSGTLLLSGILEQDKDLVEDRYNGQFDIESCHKKGKWLCYKLTKRTS